MFFKFPDSIRVLLKATNIWKNNSLFLREFKYFPRIAILALVFTFLAATFEGVSLGFLLSFLQNLTTPDSKPIHTGISWFDILILGINTSAIERLYRVSGLILISSWIRSIFNYLAQIFTEITQIKFVDRLRKQIFEQLQAVSLSFFTTTNTGELINTVTTEVERFKQAFGGGAFLLSRSLTIITYLLAMLILSWKLTLIALLLFSLMAASLSKLIAIARERSFPVSTANERFISTAIEFINGIRTVQAFATQDFERKRYYQASFNLVTANTKLASIWSLVKPLSEGIATTILVGMIVTAFSVLVYNGTLQVASLLTFFFVLFRVVPMLQDFNGNRAILATMQGSTENIKALLRTDNKKYLDNGHIEFKKLNHSINFMSVDFGYDDGQLVLNNVDLIIERGQMTALIGASGAGKSTLADLITRFYDPTAGQISIDGIDLRQLEISSFRHKMAVVSQDTFIFNASVRDNIAYGTENAAEDAIYKAARSANALEFIQDMPEGFNTILGDRGVRLSGGQRQRIAIARALLRDPEILILDEATSALDSVTERLIQDSLEMLSKGRTVIVIAHRLSTINKADKIVVMEQGKIVEQGTYLELLTQQGKFWNYHQMQNNKTLSE